MSAPFLSFRWTIEPLLRARDTLLRGSRFLAASGAAFAIDMVCVAFLLAFTDLSSFAAMAGSFAAVAAASYFVHELWTFKSRQSRFSAKRMLGTGLSALFSLGVRALALLVLKALFETDGDLSDLVFVCIAAGFSLISNFVLNSALFASRDRRASQ